MTLKLVPFNDLSRGTRAMRSELDSAIDRVIDRGWFVLGPEHDAFEEEFARYVGVDHVVAVANGTDALELALAALGVGPGSLVLTVANAGAYTSTAALALGAEPVFVDVDERTHLMSANTLTEALTRCGDVPAAIVVTHLYGALAPVSEIRAIAARHGIPVVEDCAQSMGARTESGLGGSLADIATTSFYPTKNLGALGDGGAVMTNDADLAETVRRMRQYGWSQKYAIEYSHGRNSRLDELQAAILRVKLTRLDVDNARRSQIHRLYEGALADRSGGSPLRLVNESGPHFVAHLAVLETSDRTQCRSDLSERGIATEVHYPIPDHQQRWPDFSPRSMPLSNTEFVSQRVVSIPLFPELTDAEVERVVEALGQLP